ncbi:MAG TPA: two-component regulator propeller domain-containing protein [Flavobacteriaceae bacterium]|nr:two-component regulator propeller domain-containing protein [Flavobacteriaceae bacterium]
MIKRIIVCLFCLIPLVHFGQDFSALWEGHFSYYNIKDVSQGDNKIFAAAENAIFVYDTTTNEIEEITTIQGLSGEIISTIHYSETYELLVIGYENGLIEIVFDSDDNVLSVVDILDKQTISPSTKMINHFNEYNGLIYISTNYGISVYDLERLEFGDTYFIGSLGSQIPVRQTTIFQDYIYVACFDNSGVKKALSTNNNLIDYQQWQTVIGGNWQAIQTVEDKLYAMSGNRNVYRVENDVFVLLSNLGTNPLDVKAVSNLLIITTVSNVFVYDSDFNLLAQVNVSSEFETEFTSATLDSEYIYIGTETFGVLKTPINNPTTFEEIHPEGPLLNNPFSLEAQSGNLWVTFGEYTSRFNPYPLNNRGISHLNDETWNNILSNEVFGASNLNSISINPFNNNQVFISSFFSGLLEVNDDVPTILYNQTNSDLESLILPNNPNYIDIRVGTSVFDRNGLLWTVTSRIDRPLKSYNPSSNQWQSYSFTDIISDPLNDELGHRDIAIGNDGTKWIGSFNHGIIGFNNTGGTVQLKYLSEESQNMPSYFVSALALDNRNRLWIGTFRGLRVLYNTSNFFTDDNVQVEEIIILEDGTAKELLFQQFISDIEVDGSNNKWVGTIGAGLFYFSSDGQKTIFHFTKDNSPLPSDNISDVSIDESQGVVYIATERGLVSFRAGGSSISEDLENAYVYPNPVRPSFNIVDEKVKISGISENVNIKITDIEGNLVAEAQSRTNLRYNGYNLEISGGIAYWNGKNLANNIVASGVYLVMLSDLDTFETKVLKVMVVR